MPRVQRLSDLIEVHSEFAIYYGFGSLCFLGLGGTLVAYRGPSNMFGPLGIVLLIIGTALLGVAARALWHVKDAKGTGKGIECPYCQADNVLLEVPEDDFPCIGCHRMIPMLEGQVVRVHQVRCGYCNELNYYSDKTDALLCESCNHEIPIAGDDSAPTKVIPKIYAVVEDEALYELMLTGKGQHKQEELIQALQHILALNRGQVKQMLDELPVTVLTGITRKKAEMLKAQLGLYEGQVEFKPMEQVRH